MKNAFGNSFPRSPVASNKLVLPRQRLFRPLPLDLLDERSHGVDGSSIPFMASFGLACASDCR